MSVVEKVVEKFVLQLEVQLADRNVMISLTDPAKLWLAEKGYDKLFGARPLGRLIQEKIKKPLADELLFGKLRNGGEVTIHVKDGSPSFEITPAAPKKPKPKSAPKKNQEKVR